MTEAALRQAICATGRDLYRAGLVAGRAGNISVRLDVEHILVTEAGSHKGRLLPHNLVIVPLDGEADERATTELPMHRAAHLARPEVGAVIHAHAPALTAAGLRDLDIGATVPELETAIGTIATVEFLPSGSNLLGHAVGRVVADGATIILLRRHGVVAVGSTVTDAFDRLEMAELAATAVVMGSPLDM